MTRTRRWILGALVVSGVLGGALGAIGYLAVWKYERNFVGRSEAQVISALGTPAYDSRSSNQDGRRTYTLGWSNFAGSRLGLEFTDGTVTRQWHGSR
ncbi:MAG TPA: hypothetical protein VF950_13780 [Planctomycetota bacterium]